MESNSNDEADLPDREDEVNHFSRQDWHPIPLSSVGFFRRNT